VIGEEVARLRQEYEAEGLVESTMAEDPLTQFRTWFDGAAGSGLAEPNAFVLATVDEDGTPSARALLMKGLEGDGLVFYTGLESRKSRAMRSNGRAAATFVWIPLHRQVRFEGSVIEVEPTVADEYFASRPRGAQIAAHASRQSEPVDSRDELDARFRRLVADFGDSEIPRPTYWGGWKLVPDTVEFWQGQPNRFHDRVVYSRSGTRWVKQRLSP
jgi:pyridoxamine 5'-phosphate oxidase